MSKILQENHYYSEFRNDITYRYIIRTRLKSNGNWKQQYPILVREKQTIIRKFLTWFGIGPYEKPSIDTPYLNQEKTVKIAQKYLDDPKIRDVIIVNEWWDSSGYCEGGEKTIWKNGNTINYE